MLTAAAGLDPALAAEIDGRAPATGVLVDAPGGEATHFAIGVSLVDARRARAKLLAGNPPVFRAREVAGGVTVLERTNPRAPAGAAPLAGAGLTFALVEGALVVLSHAEDAAAVAPYVVTVARRPFSVDDTRAAAVADVPHAALVGPLSQRAAAVWAFLKTNLTRADDDARAAHGGRGADFGEPKTVLDGVEASAREAQAILADLASVHATLAVDDKALDLEARARPASPDGPAASAIAAMQVGDAAPLAETPAAAALALLVRGDPKARAESARSWSDAVVRTLGTRLAAADATRIHGAFDTWARACGDWLTVAVDPQARTCVLRAPTADESGARRAMRGLLDLVAIDAIAAPLANAMHVRGLRYADVDVPDAGAATIATFGRPASTGAREPAPYRVGWLASAGELRVAVAEHVEDALSLSGASLVKERPPVDVAAVRDATFAAVVRPFALLGHGAPGARAVVAWGRRDGGLWLRVAADQALARDVVDIATR
jgi:hypothetical protein